MKDLPRLERPAVVNAIHYWARPKSFVERCKGLGDRFVVPISGSGPWLCLTHPDDAKAVFTADTEVLRLGEGLRRVSPHEAALGPENLTALDGAEHLRSRRMLLPAFTGDALQSYEAVIAEKAREMVDTWPDGGIERAQEHTLSATLEIILAAVFGVTDSDRANRLREATEALLEEASSTRFMLQMTYASSTKRGYDRPFRQLNRLKDDVDEIVLEEVAERRRDGASERNDVLNRLLEARDEDGNGLSDNALTDQMRLLLIGGHDTTGNTLAWAIERLVHNPEVLARATRAAREGDDAYIDAVIYETLRMRPVFPETVRQVVEPFQLGDLNVPAGTLIVLMISALQMREDIYENPEEFDPDRFGGKRPGTYTWTPFGGGKRRCIGASMALLEARVILREMLSRLDISPATEPEENVARNIVIMVPSEGAKIEARPREEGTATCPFSHA